MTTNGPSRERVLLISYHFPPDACVGAIRPAKFAKYLSRLGWRPYIVTAKEQYATVRDDASLAEVQKLPIVRTRRFPTLVELALRVKRSLWSRAGSSAAGSLAGAAGRPARRGAIRRLWHATSRYLHSLLELPDEHVGWLIPATWTAYRLIRTHGIRIVVASSPPRTTALVGLVLSYLTRIRLVTDLRDPWFTPYFRDRGWVLSLKDVARPRSGVADTIEAWLERKIVERSATVVTTTEEYATALQQLYPALTDGRLTVIPNGYDQEDFEGLRSAVSDRKFTLSYVGTLYLDRTPKPLFKALGELIREGRLRASELEINMIGDVRYTRDGALGDLVRAAGLTECVRIEDTVSHRESLLRMMQAHVLLIFQPQQYCSIPAKIFEYLAIGRRIFCLADVGATAALIRKLGAGLVVRPDDAAAIKAGLIQLFDEFKTGRLSGCGSDISIFERAALARQLSERLHSLLPSRPSQPLLETSPHSLEGID